ncbi:MAG TPA: VOC family protein [Solirubrobacteraceae bacterium]|jgi:PhnB protein|nr:VOC family protein [Solirubrobacteraceae bacterium]
MSTPVSGGYPSLMPYLIVDGATEAIEFYADVLGATERMRIPGPDGRIGHAELDIGDSVLMLADENPEMGIRAPRGVGGSAVMMYVYVDDVDDAFARAIAAGAKSVRDLEDRFYGDRACQLEDPFGHRWDIATHVEDVSEEEMARRAAEAMGTPSST